MLAPLTLALLQGAIAEETHTYDAQLASPGGPIRFGLELARAAGGPWRAWLVNGEERSEVPRVEWTGQRLVLDLPHYDSRIEAEVSDPPRVLTGAWQKRRGKDARARLEFRAEARTAGPAATGDEPPRVELSGRWRAQFHGEEDASVAILRQTGSRLDGTFLTTTGDYRYLAGSVTAEGFSLSCFDGAHAFLFTGRLADGRLRGDFWSGDWHHQAWTAEREDSAALPDAFAQTQWNGTTKLADLRFPDLDGKVHALSEFAGQATLLVVFGSWCPNCNDEAKLLAELDAKYRARGLRILGLAFELTGEFARDAQQVRIFAERHGLALPFFLCGTADKDEATRALGLLDRVRAFPTTIFVGADGRPRAIHSGFAGPATGEEHLKLRREFEQRIEALLVSAPR